MSEHPTRFQESLAEERVFSITWEPVLGRGSFERAQEVLIACAERAAKGGKIHALTLTDNPGGKPAISPEMLAPEVIKAGIEPIVHFTCKDKSRNQLEALLYGLERAGARNILAITGDYTYGGYEGRSKPVFDLDSTQLLRLIAELNKGLQVATRSGVTRLVPTAYYPGAVVSPFKSLESEQMGQYYKLKKKLQAGARFVVTQLGFDARKFHEALLMVRRLGLGHIPVVGYIYVATSGAARAMNQNAVPGCVVPDELLAVIEQEAADRSRAKDKRIERAAKMYAFMKGRGFSGAQIGGYGAECEDVECIIQRGEELATNWLEFVHEFEYPQPNGWYYFEKDPRTGLNSETPVDRSKRPPTPFSYRLFRLLHSDMFEPDGVLFRPSRWFAGVVDRSRAKHACTSLEHLAKGITNDCLRCGDCGLPDAAYVCPTSQCPKGQRNGPCGGSFEGWCEVYPGEKQCIYVRAYQRLKHYGKEETLGEYQVPPVNYDLLWTASWLNYFMGRDHTAKRIGLQPPAQKGGAKSAKGEEA